jgi:HSP20 family molecular chaperone IbpA
MGFWKNIATKLFGDGDDDDDVVEVEHLKRRSNMAEADFGSTIIFNNGVPDYNVTLGQTGEGERVSMAAIQQAQRETDMINQRYRIGNGAARGVGVNSMAQQPPPRPINNQQQFAGSYQAPVYQQQGYYQQPVQQPMQPQPVPMQQQIPPQGQPIPLTQDSSDPAILREPFSELVMTTDTCHVLVDLPGLTKSDVNIVLTPQNEVSITFTRKTFVDGLTAELKASTKKTKGSKGSKVKPKITSQVNIPDYLLGTHNVVYPIPRPVDTQNIKRSFENGQLHLILGFLTPLEGTTISID